MSDVDKEVASPSRRAFLKRSSGAVLSLVAMNACASAEYIARLANGKSSVSYESWQDIYRKQWRWDTVSWGSHNNQCLPASCTFRVYSRGGLVWREEQAAISHASSAQYPDFNPLGCQKGCGVHSLLTSKERLRYPLKRVGERGEGKWKRVSWDEALTEVADAILDAHRDVGPAGFHLDCPHVHAGGAAWGGAIRMTRILAGICPDLNVEIGDDVKALAAVFGKNRTGFSCDNFMDAEVLVFTHTNWAYTQPPMYHFITEARYNGTEIVLLSPDYSASAVHADIHVPVKPATDAAFWLAVCQEILSNGWQQDEFISEQTDLALLVRTDNQKFLNAADVRGGRRDQFYYHDSAANAPAEAPHASLKLDGTPSLSGRWNVLLQDGTDVTVEPGLARLQRHLDQNYTPEKAAAICGIAPAVIRSLAKKFATRRTHLYIGFTSAKHYHGDLMDRSALLALALTGNWGKPGTGFNNFLGFFDHIEFLTATRSTIADGGLQELQQITQQVAEQVLKQDPNATPEMITGELVTQFTSLLGWVPPSLWMYEHAGYGELWDNPAWQQMPGGKTFGAYYREGVAKGFINAKQFETAPQVLMYLAHNPLRRQRSGRRMYLENLWPKAKLIFCVETRMSSSASYADIVLPAAWYYEKEDITTGFSELPFFTLQEKAVNPPGEARPEWEIYALLMQTISVRAEARGMNGFVNHAGQTQLYADLHHQFTLQGRVLTNLDVQKESIAFNVATGIFPQDYSYERFKQDGTVRIQSLGMMHTRNTQASDVVKDKPFYPLGWHVDKKLPYPTHTRRAQFYMDHDWYLEAGEGFPVHKDLPPIGGMHPYHLIGGHPRVSVHTLHLLTPKMARLHRGQPVAFINRDIARHKGIEDGDMIRVFNDYDSCELMASITGGVGPDQIVIYVWEANQFKNWKSHDTMLIGMPKGIHLAMDYRQLGYQFFMGSPNPTGERNLRVDFEKA